MAWLRKWVDLSIYSRREEGGGKTPKTNQIWQTFEQGSCDRWMVKLNQGVWNVNTQTSAGYAIVLTRSS